MVIIKQVRNNHPYTQAIPDVIKTWEAEKASARTNGEIGLYRNGHLVERIIPSIDFQIGDWTEIESA